MPQGRAPSRGAVWTRTPPPCSQPSAQPAAPAPLEAAFLAEPGGRCEPFGQRGGVAPTHASPSACVCRDLSPKCSCWERGCRNRVRLRSSAVVAALAEVASGVVRLGQQTPPRSGTEASEAAISRGVLPGPGNFIRLFWRAALRIQPRPRLEGCGPGRARGKRRLAREGMGLAQETPAFRNTPCLGKRKRRGHLAAPRTLGTEEKKSDGISGSEVCG